MTEALIVGIDPGSTSAVAAFNLDKELVLLESERELPPRDLIRRITETGVPVLVGCDTEKMPSTAEKVGSSLGARRFSPEEDLSRRRKEELGGEEGENSHEKDAVAAALHAFNHYQRRISKINSEADQGESSRLEIAKERFRSGLRTSEI